MAPAAKRPILLLEFLTNLFERSQHVGLLGTTRDPIYKRITPLSGSHQVEAYVADFAQFTLQRRVRDGR